MVRKSQTFSLLQFLLLLLFINVSLEQCVLGGNCPYDQGTCMGDFCKCLDGFYSLVNTSLLPEQQIYCNYEQINVYIPLVLEMCLPSIGHFYVENYWLGALKLLLFASFITTSFLKFGFVGVPSFVIKIMEKLGISLKNFCPEGVLGENEEKDDNDDNGQKDADGAEEALLKSSVVPITHMLREGNQGEEEIEANKNRGKLTQLEQPHNPEGNDVFTKELEKPLVNYEEGQDKGVENEKEENTTLTILFNISCIFWVLYFVDLYCYKFKVYTDGNGVPFVE